MARRGKRALMAFYLVFTGIALVLNVLQIGGLLSGIMIMGVTGGLFHLGMTQFFGGLGDFLTGRSHDKGAPEPDYITQGRRHDS